jgi:hypothetical protein
MARATGMKRTLFGCATFIVVGFVASHTAYALSVAGSSGKASGDPTFLDDCFLRSGLQVRADTRCVSPGGTITWVVPLPANAGNHTFAVSGTNNDDQTVMACFICVFAEDGTLNSCANLNFPVNTVSIQTTGTVTIPSNGSVNATCDFPGGSGINTINYTP